MQKWIYFLLVILSFVLYGNSIRNDYSLDDEFISGSSVQKGILGIPEILTSRYGVRAGKIALDYRPVVLVSFALEYQFFKANPHVSHFINILLYACCLIVLYNVLISVFSIQKIHEWLPLVITVFYAIHPVHTEVVNSLKNRDELFGFLFGFLFLRYGFLYFTSSENKIKYALLTLTFFTLSLVSKMVGIIYLPVFILILFFYNLLKWNKWNYLFLFTCIFLVISVSYFILSGLKRETYAYENSLIGVTDLTVILPTCLKIILYHIKLLLIPFPLRYYYGNNMFPLESAFEPAVIFSFIVHTALLITGIIQFRKREVLGLLILCYLGCMFLYFNFPIPYTGMFSERALFLSSVWFIAAMVILLYRIITISNMAIIKNAILLIGFIVFVFFSFLTIQRNFYWKNIMTLVSHDISYLENSIAANFSYANLLNNESKTTKDSINVVELRLRAEKHYEQTIRLFPYYPGYYYQFGKFYSYHLKNTEKAKYNFESTLKIDSADAGSNFELGKIYFEEKDYRRSYPYFIRAYNKIQTDSLLLFYLAQNALALGDLNSCYIVNNQFLKLYPDIKYPYLNLGVYYSTIMKDDSAVIYFEKGIALGDRNPDLLKNMVFYFNKKNNKEKADYYQGLLQQLK